VLYSFFVEEVEVLQSDQGDVDLNLVLVDIGDIIANDEQIPQVLKSEQILLASGLIALKLPLQVSVHLHDLGHQKVPQLLFVDVGLDLRKSLDLVDVGSEQPAEKQDVVVALGPLAALHALEVEGPRVIESRGQKHQ